MISSLINDSANQVMNFDFLTQRSIAQQQVRCWLYCHPELDFEESHEMLKQACPNEDSEPGIRITRSESSHHELVERKGEHNLLFLR